MVPPTSVAIPIASIISSLVTPSLKLVSKWYLTQSSQRKTAEATKPNNSLVLTSKAPSAYALVSKLNILLTILLLSANNFSFILERYSLNS